MKPPIPLQEKILAAQGNRCLYCLEEFGTWRIYRKEPKLVRRVWDHLVPYSYLQDNPEWNWAAACSACNAIKSNKMFESVKEARAYITQELSYRVPTVRRADDDEDEEAEVLPPKVSVGRLGET